MANYGHLGPGGAGPPAAPRRGHRVHRERHLYRSDPSVQPDPHPGGTTPAAGRRRPGGWRRGAGEGRRNPLPRLHVGGRGRRHRPDPGGGRGQRCRAVGAGLRHGVRARRRRHRGSRGPGHRRPQRRLEARAGGPARHCGRPGLPGRGRGAGAQALPRPRLPHRRQPRRASGPEAHPRTAGAGGPAAVPRGDPRGRARCDDRPHRRAGHRPRSARLGVAEGHHRAAAPRARLPGCRGHGLPGHGRRREAVPGRPRGRRRAPGRRRRAADAGTPWAGTHRDHPRRPRRAAVARASRERGDPDARDAGPPQRGPAHGRRSGHPPGVRGPALASRTHGARRPLLGTAGP